MLKLSPNIIFAGTAFFTLSTIFVGIGTDRLYLLVLPLVLLFGAFIIMGFKQAYWLLLALLPLSVEMQLGSLGTDLPTEPLMIVLAGATLAFYLANPKKWNRQFIQHPIIASLFIHLAWLAITVVYSQLYLVSIKFLLAKLWYIIPFVFLTALFIKNHKDWKAPFWCIFIPFMGVIAYSTLRHASFGFGFHESNIVVKPFFRGHVNYAVMLVVFFPFVWYARQWYRSGTLARFLVNIGVFSFIFAIIIAQSRAAYASLLLLPFFYYMIQWRLTRWLVGAGVALLLIFGTYYGTGNRYLNLAPDFATTIYHDDLEGHLSATFEGKDVSFMERVYRWMAAINMSKEQPITGFGPGNFYNFYKSYTLTSFETYVSDNPEQSGVHNYFLMMLVDQGWIGMILFMLLCIVILVYGEQIYHQQTNSANRYFTMIVLISSCIIMINITMSDLIEVDKIGSFFFINMAILVNLGISKNGSE